MVYKVDTVNTVNMTDNVVINKHSKTQPLFEKLAIFDYDGTIVKAKEGRQFPKNVDDWMYIRKSVPKTIRKFSKKYSIVIVTDQSKDWKVKQIKNVMKDLKVKYTAIIGFKINKPCTSLFDEIIPEFNNKKSFYVGDAGGRENDWSDVDKKFAKNIKVKFYCPEEIFPLDKIKNKLISSLSQKNKEVVIMVGYPASGKSTIAKELATSENNTYHITSGDIYKTPPKMIKDAEQHLDQSIIFDSTGGNKEKRSKFVDFAKKHGLKVRVFWVKTPIEEAIERNKQRKLEGGNSVPNIAFYAYRKHFEEPNESEGFEIVNL